MGRTINRRQLIQLISASAAASWLSSCAYARIDLWSPYLRSELVDSPEKEREIVSKGRVETTADGRMKVLFVRGTPYERGFQYGALLRAEVQDNLGYMWEQSVKKFHTAEIFAEAYERQRPYIPAEYVQEMHGLAHGSKMPLHVIQGIHALPEMTEWGGKKKLKKILKQMMAGELATSCSNLAVSGSATKNNSMYVVRILDWGLHKISKLHEHAVIVISRPDKGYASANIGWIGFLGAISGMNERGITLGEMGYGDKPQETLSGKPMPFLLRDVMTYSDSLADVRKIISESPATNSFVFLMSDGKSQDAELYIRDPGRFLVFKRGEKVVGDDRVLPAIEDTVYGGHFTDVMGQQLKEQHGVITPELLMKDLIPQFAMKSNFQNVVYDPVNLQFWVANAANKDNRAAEQPYTFFDLKAALKSYP